jgi:hypothetical protein
VCFPFESVTDLRDHEARPRLGFASITAACPPELPILFHHKKATSHMICLRKDLEGMAVALEVSGYLLAQSIDGGARWPDAQNYEEL